MAKRFLLALVACLAFVANARAATFTSKATGNWAATGQTTWNEVGAPGSGDTVTINNGHTITIPASTTATVGSSPADDTGTPAIQCSSASGTGVLVVNGTLIYKGPIRQATGTWTIGQDAVITHDSSGAAVPATANYRWTIGQTHATKTTLVINGTAGHRVTFGIAASSGKSGGFNGGETGYDLGLIEATYASFSEWGTAAGYFIRSRPMSSGSRCSFDHCLFDSCGFIAVFECALAADFKFNYSSFRTPIETYGRSIAADTAGNGFATGTVTGTWEIKNSYLEGQVGMFNSAVSTAVLGLHITDSVLAGKTTSAQYPLAVQGGCSVGEWNNVLLYNRVSGTGNPCVPFSGTHTRTILLRTGGGLNPHFLEAMKGSTTFDGWIAENDGVVTGANGDLFQTECKATSAATMLFKNGVVVPQASNGLGPCSIVNHSTATAHNGTTQNAPNITLEHCTWPATDNGSDSGGAGGENNVGKAGLYASVQSNLIWNASSAAGWVTKPQDSVDPATGYYTTCDYNGYYNVTGLRYYRSVSNADEYTNAPGTHDINGNPSFVDSSRNFLTWAQSVDGTVSSWSDALNRFSKMNDDSGSVPGFTVTAAYDWIRAGWAPTNAALNGTGHDGTDVGGVQFDVPATGVAPQVIISQIFNPRRWMLSDTLYGISQ